MELLCEEIKVTIGQSMHKEDISKELDPKSRFRYKEPEKQLETMNKVLKVAINDQSNFVLFPEFFLPRKFLYSHVKQLAIKNRIIIMGGMEHGPIWCSDSSMEPLTNEAFIVIPENLFESFGSKHDATVIQIPKLHPAPSEKKLLDGQGYTFSSNNRVYLFSSKKIGSWAVLICFDFLNLPIQALLQSKIQTLFVLAYNKDVSGFLSVADTIQRLLLCNVVVCNTGYYGGSLAFSPYRKREKRLTYQVLGNHIEAAVTVTLPIKKLAYAQLTGSVEDENGEAIFIQRPPDFGNLRMGRIQQIELS